MARGWESKSVEEQQAEAAVGRPGAGPALTPQQRTLQAQKQGLVLARKHVLQQLQVAHNPQHRKLLQQALADLDARSAALDSVRG
jgi:hypothetical protein